VTAPARIAPRFPVKATEESEADVETDEVVPA
jgi:hypothetical protein